VLKKRIDSLNQEIISIRRREDYFMDINQPFKNTKDTIKNIVQPFDVQHNAELNSAEIATLWNTYMHYSLLTCVFKYFEKVARDNNDGDIKSLMSYALKSFDTRLKWIRETFEREKLTIPVGSSDNDVNIDAPPLYSNSYLLYYLKSMIMFGLVTHVFNINMSSRTDVRDFYTEIITTILELNKKTTNVMLERGILWRHPVINVQDEAELTRKPSFFTGFIGKRRPLLAVEIAPLYDIALLNFIGKLLLDGFRQVAKSDRVRDYMNNGVRIASDIIDTMASKLKEENIPAPLPGDAYITDSKTAPFSDRLMMFHLRLLSYSGMCMYGSALCHSMRHDLQEKYALIIANTGRYAEEGVKIMMENGWMEEPPQVVRNEEIKKLH
jgi:hypothetical protein